MASENMRFDTASELPYGKDTPGIRIVDSVSGNVFYEKVWGNAFIELLYGSSPLSRSLGSFFRQFFAKAPFISHAWGRYHDLRCTRKKIASFCDEYSIDTSEFEKPVDQFSSFNDFFTRSLKPSSRPIDRDPKAIAAPADARYTFLPSIEQDMPFTIKGTSFDLSSFFQDDRLAHRFLGGSAIIARLCPSDCHRFFFPYDGTINEPPKAINGPLYSVSPIATSRFPYIWWNNKRVITCVETRDIGSYIMAEVGATNCGSIVQTHPMTGPVYKGQEKGFFRLGGSAIILFFEKNAVSCDSRLIALQKEKKAEVYCSIGQRIACTSRALS